MIIHGILKWSKSNIDVIYCKLPFTKQEQDFMDCFCFVLFVCSFFIFVLFCFLSFHKSFDNDFFYLDIAWKIAFKWVQTSLPLVPGGLPLSKSYVDVLVGPRKSDYIYTNFLPNFLPINIPFSEEKHPIFTKLGAFYNFWPKKHPIYVIWAPPSLDENPRTLYQILQKSAPKGRHIYVYHVNVRTPSPGLWSGRSWDSTLNVASPRPGS